MILPASSTWIFLVDFIQTPYKSCLMNRRRFSSPLQQLVSRWCPAPRLMRACNGWGTRCQRAALVRCFTLLPKSTDISISGTISVRENLTAEAVSEHLQRPLHLVRTTTVSSSTLLSNSSDLSRMVEHQSRSNRSSTFMYLSARQLIKCHGSFGRSERLFGAALRKGLSLATSWSRRSFAVWSTAMVLFPWLTIAFAVLTKRSWALSIGRPRRGAPRVRRWKA